MLEQEKIKIHGSLNILIVIGIQVAAWFLLFLASHTSLLLTFFLGIFFSFLLLTNYVMMHEAVHHIAHRNSRINDLLGFFSCLLFPQSYKMFEIAHHTHHRGNRTDHEMFDYYYPEDNKFVKRVQWYGILTGLWYPLIPLGTLIMALVPGFYQTKLFSKTKTSGIFFQEYKGKNITRIRIEVLLALLIWVGMWQLLGLSVMAVAICYIFFGFNWATRQYVTHAWTPRNVVEGAVNLKVGKIMSVVFMNTQWDHVHHKYPYLPWTELSNKKYQHQEPKSYLTQYLSLWKGPRPNQEPAPEPIWDVDENPDKIFV